MAFERDITSSTGDLRVGITDMTRDVSPSYPTHTAKKSSPSEVLTLALNWTKENQILSIEHVTSHSYVCKESISTKAKDDFLTERKLRGFFTKINKAVGKSSLVQPFEIFKTNDNEIPLWIAEGFTSLEILKQKNKSFPWQQIAALGHPELIEQLILLQKLLEEEPFDSAPAQTNFLMKQALIIARQASSPFIPKHASHDTMEMAQSEIAKLIFAADRSPIALINQVRNCQGGKLSEWLETNLLNAIHQTQQKITLTAKKHAQTKVQSSDLVERSKLLREMSELLLLKNGWLNSGFIHVLIKQLLTPEGDVELISKLSLLKNNPKLRSIINALNPTSPPHALLSMPLDMHEQQPLKRTLALSILNAYLSHLRQGNEGSCFATFLAINMLASRPVECVKDFAELLQNGSLTKHCEGIATQFPFMPIPCTEAIEKKILSTHQGQTLLSNGLKPFLWESTGIQVAAQAMGILNVKAAVEEYLKKLSPTAASTMPLIIKPIDLIRSFSSSEEMQYKGICAFEAEETSPLLQAWVNSIAGMAETNESGIIKSALVTTVHAVLMEKVNQTNPPFPKPLIELFFSYFNEELNKSLRFLYDRTIDNAKTGVDQHSKKGGFVLFDRNRSLSPDKWLKVDSHELFNTTIEKYVLHVLGKVKEQGSIRLSQWLEPFGKKILESFESDDFLNQTIKNINSINNKLKTPLEHVKELKYTPWLIRSGNNPKKILEVYLETNELPITEKFLPLSAPNLLQKVLQLGQTCSQNMHNLSMTNPYLITPVRTPGLHSFSLMLGHPSLLKGLEKGTDINAWLQESVIRPGKSITNSPITPAMRHALVDFCLKKLLLPKQTQPFLDMYLKIPPQVTIKEFRYQLKEILINIQTNPSSLSTYMRKLDTQIYQFLPAEQKEILEKSAVHFADTNWYEGAHDVHFCFVVNPGNGKLEIWEVMDNGKNLSAADQMAWLQDHEWEIYQPFFLDKETTHV